MSARHAWPGRALGLATTLLVLTAGCTVPHLTIEERASAAVLGDAAAEAGALEDAGVEGGSASKRDAGMQRPIQRGKPQAGTAANAGGGGTGGKRTNPGGSGATAADSGITMMTAAAGSGASAPSTGAAGGGGDTAPAARACVSWVMVNVRDSAPPAGAVEGGFETVAGVTNRQYVCRFRPPGSNVTIPGKYIAGLGCYVTYRRDGQQVDDASMLDGMVEVLTPAPGCSFSWRTATPSQLPSGAIDLGDPAGGRHYACHGDFGTVASSGKQVGTLIATADTPAKYQCWMESFANAIQPSDPQLFEVLVQD